MVRGWSSAAARRNEQFLLSVHLPDMLGRGLRGVAFTLTVRDCPPSPEEWARLRSAFIKRARRIEGVEAWHWVTEWQRRGCPHLHGMFWVAADSLTVGTRVHQLVHRGWEDIAGHYGAARWGQHVRVMEDGAGWFEYLSKHAARGVNHYQRSAASIPKSWLKGGGKTGRLWGRGGAWSTLHAAAAYIDESDWYALRRLARSREISRRRRLLRSSCRDDIRRARARSLRSARSMLRCRHRSICAVRGVTSWLPADAVMRWLNQRRRGRGD